MADNTAHVSGELERWPKKDDLAGILRSAGLQVSVGRYSVRVEDCSHFSFEEYGGDLGDPIIDADADSLEEMLRDVELVSKALASAGIRHRFEVYDSANRLVGYVHHLWPSKKET